MFRRSEKSRPVWVQQFLAQVYLKAIFVKKNMGKSYEFYEIKNHLCFFIPARSWRWCYLSPHILPPLRLQHWQAKFNNNTNIITTTCNFLDAKTIIEDFFLTYLCLQKITDNNFPGLGSPSLLVYLSHTMLKQHYTPKRSFLNLEGMTVGFSFLASKYLYLLMTTRPFLHCFSQ